MYEKARTLDKTKTYHFSNSLLALYYLGRFEEVIALSIERIETFPDDPDGFINLALFYDELNRDDEAEDMFRHGIAIGKDSDDAHF